MKSMGMFYQRNRKTDHRMASINQGTNEERGLRVGLCGSQMLGPGGRNTEIEDGRRGWSGGVRVKMT